MDFLLASVSASHRRSSLIQIEILTKSSLKATFEIMRMRTYRTLDSLIQEQLSTPENRALYLDIAVEDYVETGDEAELLLAIRQVVQAGIGFAKLAEETGFSRESLYKTLSGKGNPKLKTIKEILAALGYTLYFKKQSP